MWDSTATLVPGGSSYYANERGDIVAALPLPVGRVLDVGCGGGGVAPGLRRAGAREIVGIEPDPASAAQAHRVLDQMVVAPVESAFSHLAGPFDIALCLDVLEHLVDPRSVLERLRAIAARNAHLQVSVPNARHYSLVPDLVLRGTFGYADWDHRDSTHLRWFTRRDIVELVSGAGWRVTGTSVPPLGRSAPLHRIKRGWSSGFLVAQVYLSATNR
jgi:2-polyprenyl-3-methyl-5-hydroxy-6-metoxy-1,4-benzoquinol methylase